MTHPVAIYNTYVHGQSEAMQFKPVGIAFPTGGLGLELADHRATASDLRAWTKTITQFVFKLSTKQAPDNGRTSYWQ